MMFARPVASGAFDTDATDYFARIVTAGSTISEANKTAVNSFVVGCKADGIWTAIKASCILAGADTLAGALVPLVGAAPTNVNFVSGDYSRTTGLIGDGSPKYLNSNRHNTTDPQNNKSGGVWLSSYNLATVGHTRYMGSFSNGSSFEIIASFADNSGSPRFRHGNVTLSTVPAAAGTGMIGMSRSNGLNFDAEAFGTSSNFAVASAGQTSSNIGIFCALGTGWVSPARLSFYWVGEAINMPLLRARLTTLMTSLT